MGSAGDFGALIALRSKQGELQALNELHDDLGVQPLLVLEAREEQSPLGMLNQVERAARSLYELGRVVIADVSAFHSNSDRFDWLEQLADRLHAPAGELPLDPIPFIPVVRPGDEPHLLRLRALVEDLGCGCALRVSPSQVRLDEVVRLMAKLNVADVDLIVDLRYVPAATEQLTAAASAFLDGLLTRTPFRSATLLSGSVPKSLRNAPVCRQVRHEEEVWRAVAAGLDSVRFGDYGVVHPISANPLDWWSDHVAVKYSCPEHWLYVRQRIRVVDDRRRIGEAVGAASDSLVRSGSFAGAEFSWGDRCFATVAATGRTEGYGSMTKVVALSTSHHLSYLADLAAA